MLETEMTGKGEEWVDCFFCEKPNVCKFIDGKGYVALGERADRSDFGTHAMCEDCRKPRKT